MPVQISGSTHKLYLEDLQKIYRNVRKIQKPIPTYPKMILRKPTQETQPDLEAETEEFEEESFRV